jgi:hypothetical protein
MKARNSYSSTEVLGALSTVDVRLMQGPNLENDDDEVVDDEDFDEDADEEEEEDLEDEDNTEEETWQVLPWLDLRSVKHLHWPRSRPETLQTSEPQEVTAFGKWPRTFGGHGHADRHDRTAPDRQGFRVYPR